MQETLAALEEITGIPAPKMKIPYWVALAAAHVDETISAFTGKPPKAPLAGVRMAKYKMWFNPAKAIRELGLPQTPPKQALADAVEWFRANGKVTAPGPTLNPKFEVNGSAPARVSALSRKTPDALKFPSSCIRHTHKKLDARRVQQRRVCSPLRSSGECSVGFILPIAQPKLTIVRLCLPCEKFHESFMAHVKLHIPGPVEVSEKTFKAFCSPMIGHRGQGFKDLYAKIQPQLQQLLYTKQLVYISTSSAWGVMEGAIRNLVQKKVLNCMCGAFSDKWFDVSKRCGKQAEALQVDWGSPIRAEAIDAKLATGEFDALTLIHNETSTGVMSPLAEIAALKKKYPDVMFIVDAVSSMSARDDRIRRARH